MGLTSALVLLLPLLGAPAAAQQDPDAVLRGKYLFHAGACDSCHTDHPNHGAFLAGGRRMDTEFGTFYVPNITPDRETGIGAWSAEDFRRAMIEGRTPAGSHYYPVFPYRWYTGMSEQDVADMWAYLQSVPPVRNRVREHDLPFPFNLRFLLLGWKLINFDQGATVHDPERSEAWNRGAYLVNHLGHCGACHTPKMLFGAVFRSDKFLAGSEVIPGPYPAPNITPHEVTGIGNWTDRGHGARAQAFDQARRRADPRPDGGIRGQRLEPSLASRTCEAAAIYLFSLEAAGGPGTRAARNALDRRLQTDGEPQSGSEGASGGGGMGSAGMGLLRAASGGRTRAK